MSLLKELDFWLLQKLESVVGLLFRKLDHQLYVFVVSSLLPFVGIKLWGNRQNLLEMLEVEITIRRNH